MMDTLKEVMRAAGWVSSTLLSELLGGRWETPVTKSILDDKVAFGTQTGLARRRNEDRFALARFRAGQRWLSVAVVCDGVGGSQQGDEAAAIAVSQLISELMVGHTNSDLYQELDRAIRAVDATVSRVLKGRGATTLSVVIVDPAGSCFIANVGDSRIYSWTPGAVLEQLTLDDTIENELRGYDIRDASFVDARGIRGHLSQAIGEPGRSPEDLKVNIKAVDTSVISGLVIGSDGLWKVCEPAFHVLAVNAQTAIEIARRSLAMSGWFGGLDNATIIAIASLKSFGAYSWGGSERAGGYVAWVHDNKILGADDLDGAGRQALRSPAEKPISDNNRISETADKKVVKRQSASSKRKKKTTTDRKPVAQLRLLESSPLLEVSTDDNEGQPED